MTDSCGSAHTWELPAPAKSSWPVQRRLRATAHVFEEVASHDFVVQLPLDVVFHAHLEAAALEELDGLQRREEGCRGVQCSQYSRWEASKVPRGSGRRAGDAGGMGLPQPSTQKLTHTSAAVQTCMQAAASLSRSWREEGSQHLAKRLRQRLGIFRDFSRITSESLVPLCSPSPHSGFGVPPASLLGATVRKRGLRRINEKKVRQRHVPGSLPACRWGKGSLVEARRALLSLQTLQRNLLARRAHRETIFLR